MGTSQIGPDRWVELPLSREYFGRETRSSLRITPNCDSNHIQRSSLTSENFCHSDESRSDDGGICCPVRRQVADQQLNVLTTASFVLLTLRLLR